MPKRKDINKVMIIGSGPIIIGQGIRDAQIRTFYQADKFHLFIPAHPLVPPSLTCRDFFYIAGHQEPTQPHFYNQHIAV